MAELTRKQKELAESLSYMKYGKKGKDSKGNEITVLIPRPDLYEYYLKELTPYIKYRMEKECETATGLSLLEVMKIIQEAAKK